MFEVTHGGITRHDLLTMPFDEYEETVRLTQDMIRKQNEAMQNGR